MSYPKSVDSSLWWDPFSIFLTDLEKASLSAPLPSHLAKKLKENHEWFLHTVSRFKPPNEESKEALNSSRLQIGSHQLIIKPELKDKALQISSYLALDEVQTYILVERSFERSDLGADSVVEEYLHVVLLDYYIERQCLLKCSRRVLMHALYVGLDVTGDNFIRDEALNLISDGFEGKLIHVLQDLLSAGHPEQMDLDLFTLWGEEMLIEENVVLDILFLVYHESLCTCNGEKWKKLCSMYKGILSGSCNSGKLAVSAEALKSYYNVKVQLLLILMRTLDLENLLRLVHDEIPYRQGASSFSLNDIQQMDLLVSSFDTFEMKEAGPLILAWAVCLCLISSLPGREVNNVLEEIDHVGYVRQAFEASSLSYFIEILESDIMKESDGPVAGYRSALRTFVSAFIASYEINLQLEDSTLNLVLDILCKIYRGEESLCIQFWDRESFIDGPIRCLLCNLEGEFPFRTVELVRLLSSLCEGSWPAECVYNFLDKSVGISSLFTSESMVDDTSHMVETHLPLHVPGVESLLIPSKTRGHILKVISGNTALVRWEYAQSGLLVLLLRLAHEMYLESKEEVLLIFDLLNRMVSFNMTVTFSLMDIDCAFYSHSTRMNGQMEKNFWVVDVICGVIKKLSASSDSAAVMSMGVSILAKMLKCSPSHVAAVTLKTNIFEMALKASGFDVGYNGSSSGSWLLSGRLANMLLVDSELNDYDNPLTISVLEFTKQLVERRIENDLVQALVVFSLQYILVNHGYWKYKAKYVRWKVTLKVLELMKICIMSIPFSGKLGLTIREIVLSDSSIHSSLFHLMCTTKQNLENLYVSRLYEPVEIEGFELAIASALDILHIMLSRISKDILPSLPIFHQAVLSSNTKPIPVVAAVTSLISYFRNTAIQLGAARVLSALLMMADYLQPYASAVLCFGLDDKQITDLRNYAKIALLEQLDWNEDLFIAIVNLLTSAARYQPAYLAAIFTLKEEEVQLSNASDMKKSTNEALTGPVGSNKSSLGDAIIQCIERSDDLMNSNPCLLFSVLNFLKALWQGAVQYMGILEYFKSSGRFWKQLSNCISSVASLKTSPLGTRTETEARTLAYKYQCQCAILEIIALEIFLRKKLLHAESLLTEASELNKSSVNPVSVEKSKFSSDDDMKDILSHWCDKSIFGSLIKSYTSCEYDNAISYGAKVAASLFIVHVMGKLATGSGGSLSVSLLEMLHATFKNFSSQLAFSELLVQYSQRGYSEGDELKHLVLNDLYYHLQGELEGRNISAGPFKQLSQYLLESKCFQAYKQKCDDELYPNAEDVCLYDIMCIKSDLALNMWDYTEWNASKAIAEKMLECMQQENSMVFVASSKLSALQALISLLTVYEDSSIGKKATTAGKIPEQLSLSCIDQICHSFHSTVDSLAPSLDASQEILDFLRAQAELLLLLMRSVQSSLSSSVCVLVLKTSNSGLKILSDCRSSVTGLEKTTNLLLLLLLLALEMSETSNKESEDFAEVSNICLGLLPILCSCTSAAEHFTLSLTAIDLILRIFLTPNTWFPIIKKHLQLQNVIIKLQEKNFLASASITLKFLLTLARVKGGAEMLLVAGFFMSLRVLFTDFSDIRPAPVNFNDNDFLKSSGKTENPQEIWGLGLAVVTAIIHALGDSSSCAGILENVIPYLFSEKAYLILNHLNSPDFPSDSQDKKRPRAQRTQTSLSSLKETEHTLMLMCILAKHWSPWVKTMKEVDSQLREKSIHLLAFISRGIHRFGESPGRTAPLLCPPKHKEEFECFKKPPFLNCKNGWFALSPLCCATKYKFSIVSPASTTIVVRGQSGEVANPMSPTYFSDLVALQIYRIAFLVLKFLCLEAESASVRSEEVGYVDLTHIPELPMPEILHGVQDQAISIVSELCNANKGKDVPEIQSTCFLLLQIMEMALYLELCVLKICGIRPVLGRVEDFSKEVKLLMKAMEGHAFLEASVKSLNQILSFVYPGLLQTEGFM